MEVAVPIVSVLPGHHEVEHKRELVARITRAFVDAYDVPPESVQVWIHEVPTDSWAVGGRLTADK